MKLTTETIQLPQTYSIPEEAEQFRDALLDLSKIVAAVDDADSQSQAVNMAREIQAHLMEVEEARKTLTAPLLEAQRKLMELSRAHCEPLQIEKLRISGLVSLFQVSEQKRIAELERIKQAEVERLEAERRQAKLDAEKAAQVAAVSDDIATEIQAHNAQQAFEDADKASYTAMLTPIAPKVKAAGSSTRTKLCFEVLDADTVYKARPDLCALEVKKSAVLSTCTIKSVVPGLRFYEEVTTSIRR